MAHELQERYSKLVDVKLRATLVKKDGVIFNNRYEGDPKAGKVKVPVRDTEVTVADYSKTAGAGATHGDTAYIDVTVDKDKAVNEIIDGFDAAAVPDNLVADRLDSAAYSMALQIEKDATAVLEAQAVSYTHLDVYKRQGWSRRPGRRAKAFNKSRGLLPGFLLYSMFNCCFSPACNTLEKLMCAASAASFSQEGTVQFLRTARMSFARR